MHPGRQVKFRAQEPGVTKPIGRVGDPNQAPNRIRSRQLREDVFRSLGHTVATFTEGFRDRTGVAIVKVR
jgi:hypothetical protein